LVGLGAVDQCELVALDVEDITEGLSPSVHEREQFEAFVEANVRAISVP
jgi:hypothetical protein